MGNLCKFKVTEAELVEADERAKEETGQTWSPMQYYTDHLLYHQPPEVRLGGGENTVEEDGRGKVVERT